MSEAGAIVVACIIFVFGLAVAAIRGKRSAGNRAHLARVHPKPVPQKTHSPNFSGEPVVRSTTVPPPRSPSRSATRYTESICTKAFYGRVVWIVDGDTIHVRRKREVLKIRLNGLDAPELDQYGGLKAKSFMFGLVRGQTILCHPIELDNYGRTVAICYLNGKDIAAEAVKAGVALDCRVFSGGRYAHLEQPGAANRLGRRTYSRS
ncbi:thermonuclease family protein [Labrenzia sp. PHM005]|uniref:thermonuclease family protein n=1 Tax=Labrenzia sp. PHM005 TaxID=2590016 RepID=UPI00143DD4CD|nr:thermonuclease family protein [Labrenzia sp. PHM005]